MQSASPLKTQDTDVTRVPSTPLSEAPNPRRRSRSVRFIEWSSEDQLQAFFRYHNECCVRTAGSNVGGTRDERNLSLGSDRTNRCTTRHVTPAFVPTHLDIDVTHVVC